MSYECYDTKGGKGVFIPIGKLRCSARIIAVRREKYYAARRMGLFPPSPNEYRTKQCFYMKTGPLIPHMHLVQKVQV
jgi:hypothetical protein